MVWSRKRLGEALLAVALAGCHLVFPHAPEPRNDLGGRLDLGGPLLDLPGPLDLPRDSALPPAIDASVPVDLPICVEPAEINLAPKCDDQSVDAVALDEDRDGVLDLLDPDIGYCNTLFVSEEFSTTTPGGVNKNGTVEFQCGQARMTPGSALGATPAFLGKLPTGRFMLEARFTLQPQPTPWSVTITVLKQDGAPITCALHQTLAGEVMLRTDGCDNGPNFGAWPKPTALDHRLQYYNDGWLVGCRVLRDGSAIQGPGVNCAPSAPSGISVTVSGIEIKLDHLRGFEKK